MTRLARVAWGGAIHEVRPAIPVGAGAEGAAGVVLPDGTTLGQTEVTWLPPFEAGTIIALGLNYADHVRELARELTLSSKDGAQDEPLVFLKTAGALVGHRGRTARPPGVAMMHYECELAVVIGRPAKRVQAADALAHVAGYTVCNDYAVRDHLENWYRPNLRVKNRDQATALGPWLVSADEVPDPQKLALRTLVNGEVKQRGSTANMVHGVAELIEYLSAFMTLLPGDVILTGTPEGVVNVNVGDEVVCEIDGVGRLVNHIVAEA